MSDDRFSLSPAERDNFNQTLDESDQASISAPVLAPIVTSLLKKALVISILMSAGAVAALCVSFPRSADEMLGLYALCVIPPVIAIVAIGVARWPVPFRILCLISLVALVGAYALIVQAKLSGVSFDQTHMLGLMMIALIPQFAGFWAAIRLPVKTRSNPPLPIFQIGVVTVVTLTVVGALSNLVSVPDFEVAGSVLCTTFVVALFPSLLASWCQARRERRVPVAKTDVQPNHISGVGASALIIFALVIVTLGIWAAETHRTQKIDRMAGIVVIFGLAFAFIAVAAAPYIPASRRVGKLGAVLKALVRPIGTVFSWIDSLLVFPVAGALGATQTSLLRRYVLLLGYIVPSAFLGWWLEPPYGLIPLGLSVVGAIAIARRWSWIEEDRENAMLNRKFEGPHIRVGFDQDLRDETLVAFMALLFLVPLIMRQLHLMLGHHVFIADSIAEADIFAWLSFFGTELAKALPFVDWAEVYNVEGNAPIHVGEEIGAAQHIIFATRILLDLVLLAAFLQAISISQRSRKLRDMFYEERSIDRLDPFVEAQELRKLVRDIPGGFELIEELAAAFPRYDHDRLEALMHPKDEKDYKPDVAFVAEKLLARYAEGGPEEQLKREAESKKPSRAFCESLIDAISNKERVNIAPLRTAHLALNSKASFWPVRLAIAELIASQIPDPYAIDKTSEILMGPSKHIIDPRQEVRRVALNALYRPAVGGNIIAQKSIERAADHDQSLGLREEAKRLARDWRSPGALEAG